MPYRWQNDLLITALQASTTLLCVEAC